MQIPQYRVAGLNHLLQHVQHIDNKGGAVSIIIGTIFGNHYVQARIMLGIKLYRFSQAIGVDFPAQTVPAVYCIVECGKRRVN